MADLDPASVEKAAEALRLADDAALVETNFDRLNATYEDAARAVLDAVVPAIREAALLEAARHFEYEMAPAWGGDSTWISTGSHVADLVGSTLRDMAAQQREEQA